MFGAFPLLKSVDRSNCHVTRTAWTWLKTSPIWSPQRNARKSFMMIVSRFVDYLPIPERWNSL